MLLQNSIRLNWDQLRPGPRPGHANWDCFKQISHFQDPSLPVVIQNSIPILIRLSFLFCKYLFVGFIQTIYHDMNLPSSSKTNVTRYGFRYVVSFSTSWSEFLKEQDMTCIKIQRCGLWSLTTGFILFCEKEKKREIETSITRCWNLLHDSSKKLEQAGLID